MPKNSPILWCSQVQTLLLVWCVWCDMQCFLTSKHGVYYSFQRVHSWSHLTRLYPPSISQACLHVVQQTLNVFQHALPSAMAFWAWVQYLLLSLKQLYLLILGLSVALCKWSRSMLGYIKSSRNPFKCTLVAHWILPLYTSFIEGSL